MSKIDKLDISDRELFNRAAIAVFANLVANQGTEPINLEKLAEEAWQAAACFIRARQRAQEAQYDRILEKFTGLDALRKILALDGSTNRGLDFEVEQYAKYSDPLRAYAISNCHGHDKSRAAIRRHLAKHVGTTSPVITTELDDDDGIIPEPSTDIVDDEALF